MFRHHLYWSDLIQLDLLRHDLSLHGLSYFFVQLDHARASLDQSYENETRLRQEAEHCKREMAKLQDKVEQVTVLQNFLQS
jgi:hypothetical protein